MYLLGKITSFEHKGIDIIHTLQHGPSFPEAQELLSDFNELLNYFKPTFVKYIALSNILSHEEPEDLFNNFTFGGKV